MCSCPFQVLPLLLTRVISDLILAASDIGLDALTRSQYTYRSCSRLISLYFYEQILLHELLELIAKAALLLHFIFKKFLDGGYHVSLATLKNSRPITKKQAKSRTSLR